MSETLRDEYKLTEKQKIAYNLMANGNNIFITGPSGTGKSSVIRMFLNTYGKSKKIAMTSTTGISALLIGGTTLHSYLGIGLGTGSIDTLVQKIKNNPYTYKKWMELDVLIIDEVSMLSPELFDKVEEIARRLRNEYIPSFLKKDIDEGPPFGGIQLIVSGDMLQLPVVKCNKFCFEGKCWERCISHVVYLTEIIRQQDLEFQTVLNNVRIGNITSKVKNYLNKRINIELKNDTGIKPTRLHTTNMDADVINEAELDILAEDGREFYEYNMDISLLKYVKNRDYVINKYRKDCIAPETIQLCVGAQVMLLTNVDIDAGLANGSRGVVTGFVEDMPMVKFVNGEERILAYHVWDIEDNGSIFIKIKQIPLKLAWANTVHKCQGFTLDYVELDLGNLFEYGQAYVALSRVKNIQGLKIKRIDWDKVYAHPKAIEFYKKFT